MHGNGAIGSALALKHTKNPISLAKKIMEDTSKPCIMIERKRKRKRERKKERQEKKQRRIEKNKE